MPAPGETASVGLVGIWLRPVWNLLGSVVPGVSAKEQCMLGMEGPCTCRALSPDSTISFSQGQTYAPG